MKKQSMEITTRIGCKLNCKYCPQDKLADTYFKQPCRAREMSFDVFKRCVDKIPVQTNIHFTGMCEPWLNSSCTQMLKYAVRKGHGIVVSTTLEGMDESDWEELRDIKYEWFCLHIPDEQMNCHFSLNKEWIKIFDLVMKDYENEKIKIDVFSCHGNVHPDIKNRVIETSIPIDSNLIDRAGNIEDCATHNYLGGKIKCKRCGCMLNNNVLLPDGTVILCCMDYGLTAVLGNLLEQTYEEILNGESIKELRYKLNQDESDIICRKCNQAISNV
ncbi:radical SAM/SPASM domain-containing protein [Butyrivibrio sp. MC2013]|uniref:radical SAM/SPASM domain-containing protein n=1 Tax=Butyrivibrio sp. MC2013 TaxID=1280686 RepID=UPI00042360A8|nr:SPASM domain-containing protein [Butyrivibrio sp. MC2013]